MQFSNAARLLAAACLVAWPSAAIAETPDRLVLAIGGEPSEGYDPLLGWGRYGHPLFQSTLLSRNNALETVPDLATDWSLSEDRLIWTIRIRPDARFSDGTPLTAADVAFTFTEAARAGGALDLSVFVSAEALDDETLTITLSRPWITFTESFYTLGIVPAASYGPGYARNPVGSGPYRLVSWSEGEQLIVSRNPHYHGTTPAFETLVFLFTDESTSLAAARAGQVDLVAVPAALADAVPTGFTRHAVPSVDNRGITFPMQPPGETTAEGAPVGNPVTSDRAIRQAINLGVDRDILVDIALGGNGRPAQGPADGLPWSNPDAALPFDPEAAIARLDEAGWIPASDGIRMREGVRAEFPLNYPSSDSTRQMLALTVAELLLPLGIEATPRGISWDQITRIMHAEPVLFGWGSHSPLEIYSLYASAWAGVEYFNAGHFRSEDVDAHLDAAQAAESLEASYPHWQAAEWDGETGFGPRGEAGWAWLVNLDHVYFADACLDLGTPQIEPHGHGWPITANLAQWRWTCD
ncbi:ABC transporter substrate-binding protein [Arsenicitalea aurantiaca]|nr:ABC transporter substrate-binding protein [Arsenicitalea aurantiaca]